MKYSMKVDCTCPVCHEDVFNNDKGLVEYVIHGKGKFKKKQFFHRNCFYREVEEGRKKWRTGGLL